MQELITLDRRLIELTNQYNKCNLEYASLEEEIEDLESQKDKLEYRMNDIERNIIHVKQRIAEIQILETNQFSGDQFKKDFIYASFFSNRGNDTNRPLFEHINITDNELWASDTRRGVIIKNNNIPTELKNTLIRWDVRENFVTNISKNIERQYPDLKEVINHVKNAAKYRENIKADYFYKLFNVKPITQGADRIIIKLSYLDLDLSFNKFFIDIALKCFDGKQFTVFIKDRESPIVFDNEAMSVIIMPVW